MQEKRSHINPEVDRVAIQLAALLDRAYKSATPEDLARFRVRSGSKLKPSPIEELMQMRHHVYDFAHSAFDLLRARFTTPTH